MPVDKHKYPKNWKLLSARIRKRAKGQCECSGECGLHGGSRKLQIRCRERQGEKALWAKGTIRLTVHHLDFNTKNNSPKNLKAMCQRCHLRCDRFFHAFNARQTHFKNQLLLFGKPFKSDIAQWQEWALSKLPKDPTPQARARRSFWRKRAITRSQSNAS